MTVSLITFSRKDTSLVLQEGRDGTLFEDLGNDGVLDYFVTGNDGYDDVREKVYNFANLVCGLRRLGGYRELRSSCVYLKTKEYAKILFRKACSADERVVTLFSDGKRDEILRSLRRDGRCESTPRTKPGSRLEGKIKSNVYKTEVEKAKRLFLEFEEALEANDVLFDNIEPLWNERYVSYGSFYSEKVFGKEVKVEAVLYKNHTIKSIGFKVLDGKGGLEFVVNIYNKKMIEKVEAYPFDM
jgi:hypothetical protein